MYALSLFYATTFDLVCETGTPPLLTPYMTSTAIIVQLQFRNPDIITQAFPHYPWISIFHGRNLVELLVEQILGEAGRLVVRLQSLVVEGTRLGILVVRL